MPISAIRDSSVMSYIGKGFQHIATNPDAMRSTLKPIVWVCDITERAELKGYFSNIDKGVGLLGTLKTIEKMAYLRA